MSYVTTVILAVDLNTSDAELDEAISKPIDPGRRATSLHRVTALDAETTWLDDNSGGSKYMELTVYTGGFNHVDIQSVREFLDGIDWGTRPACAILSANGEHFDVWRNIEWLKR